MPFHTFFKNLTQHYISPTPIKTIYESLLLRFFMHSGAAQKRIPADMKIKTFLRN